MIIPRFPRNAIRQIDATAQNKVVGHYLNFSEARSDMQKVEYMDL